MNDGSATRVPETLTKPNPLDLSWISVDLFGHADWKVEPESLGSDHLVILMSMELMMNSEEIRLKPKVNYEAFRENIKQIDMDKIHDLSDFIRMIHSAKELSTTRPNAIKNPKFMPKSYWNDEIKTLQKKEKFALVRYFRRMNIKNLIEYKRLNALFKRKLKAARKDSWRRWAETLSPNTPVKDIFRKFRQLSNFRVPNQPNLMYQNPAMVDEFLDKLCGSNSPSHPVANDPINTEAPFSMEELDFVLSSKVDSAPGVDACQREAPRLNEWSLGVPGHS